MIEIISDKIDLNKVISTVTSPTCGAVNVFIGTVRNSTKAKQVKYLEFEAYEPMAVSELKKIVKTAKERWQVNEIAVVHRTGLVKIGEEAVVIAVSSPHRDAAFEACRYVIDTLKETVPIWKKEVFVDGEVWVSAHP